jgi:hypothetical protein
VYLLLVAQASKEAAEGDTLAAYPESDDEGEEEEQDEGILKVYASTPIR